jgi:hypothetical protein
MVVGTFWVAWETRKMTKEQLQARLAEYEPIIKATLRWLGPIGVSLKIQNVGKGVAKNVEIEIQEAPTSSSPRKSVQPLLAPGASATLILEPIYFKQLSDQFDKITVKGKCVDTLGRDHPIEDTIDLKEIRRSIETAPQLVETTTDERIGDIGDKLEEIGHLLQDISSQMISGVVIKTAEEARKEYEEHLRKLDEMRKRRQDEGKTK